MYEKYGVKEIVYDLGWNEKNLTGLLQYESLLNKHTWELPVIRPNADYSNAKFDAIKLELKEANNVLTAKIRITNPTRKTVWLNGVTIAAVLDYEPNINFRFPANVPHGVFKIDELENLNPIEAGLSNFCVALETPRTKLNIMFINPEEKWATGVWKNGNKIYIAFTASVEANLEPNENLTLETLYIQPVNLKENALNQARAFVEKLGFTPPKDGMGYAGVMYSCHPFGTMDAGFASLDENLFEYAKRLPDLAVMGIEHIWLLPVFDHNESGVYHSNDQDVIDERYGGEEACKYFCEEAKKLGMSVLFDYVPHGPVPEHPLAANNPDWLSKRRDGPIHIEWECVSMDYNHPGYLEYSKKLAAGHVRRFGIQGARIDCAMGGLSNWKPRPGKRPSSSSICAGVKISKAIRDGFLQENVKPLNMPENFHPVPVYYPYTDVFYGFNLYRVLCELESLFKTNPAEYAAKLINWLKDERDIMPQNMGKLRFLGNHDTVSWVWQAKRATAIYGVDGAKALWALFSLIDGMVMIYQGDEDPAQYNNPDGPNLTEFFTKLFKERKKLSHSAETKYLHTGTPLCAFERDGALILVNLGNKEENYKEHTVRPYDYAIIK